MAAVEHLAGRLVEGVQKCTRCSAVLTDYRTAEIRYDMEGRPPPASSMPGWVEGSRVAVEGRSMWVADGTPIGSSPTCREVRRG